MACIQCKTNEVKRKGTPYCCGACRKKYEQNKLDALIEQDRAITQFIMGRPR